MQDGRGGGGRPKGQDRPSSDGQAEAGVATNSFYIGLLFFVKKKPYQGRNCSLSLLTATTTSQFRTLEGLFEPTQ